MRILDIACGTGRLLSELISNVTFAAGLDSSSAMLAKAKERLPDAKFYHQDMQSLEVDEKYNLITSTFDSINYILDIKYVAGIFRRVSKVLTDDGIFIFDFNTIHKKASGRVNKEGITYYDRISGPFWEVEIQTPNGQEHHRERLYTLQEIKTALEENSMRIKKIYSDFNTEVQGENSHPRLIIVAQKRT